MESNKFPEMEEEKGAFRLNAKKVALTYARCPLSKEEVLDFLLSKEAVIVVVSQEEHEDQFLKKRPEEEAATQNHLHAYAEWDKKKNWKDPRAFDIKNGEQVYHPHIRRCSEKAGWLKYITKEDKEPAEFGIEVMAYLKAHANKRAYIGEELITGKKTLRQVVEENPEQIFNYKQLKENLKLYQKDKEAEEKPITWRYKREGQKERHFWVFGPSNSGKTTVQNKLESMHPELWFRIPLVNNDWAGYKQQPILYADEFSGAGLTVQTLNTLCDGKGTVNEKYGISPQLPGFGKTCVVILSNYKPCQCYKKAFEENEEIRNSILNRFIMIDSSEEGWEKLLDIY